MYQVPQHIDHNKIFIVQRSEIEGRLDAQYYKMSIHIPNSVKLSSFASVKGGKRIPKGYSYSEEQTPYYYLRVADMDNDNELSLESLKFIDEEVFNKLKRYEIKKNELAISIAGTIGKICYLSGIPEGCRVVLTENCAKIVISDENVLNAKYLEILFKMPFIQKQLERNYIQTTIPKLGLDKITSLNFPQIPTLEFQKKVVEYYNSAYKQKLKYESDAQQLLNSIDAYILNELGITLPEIKTDLKSRMFLVNRSELEERLDPKFSKDFSYLKNLTCKYPFVTLNNIVLNNGQYGANERAQEYEDGSVRFIRITDIDELGCLKSDGKKTAANIENCYRLNFNDVLFARSGSVGKCYIHKEMSAPAIFAGYLIRFLINDNLVNADYLFYYCNSKLHNYWVNTIQRPAVQANINAQEFRSMPIPLPPLGKQQEIANQIYAIRQQAKQLQEEGKSILENAKKEVEQMIIG